VLGAGGTKKCRLFFLQGITETAGTAEPVKRNNAKVSDGVI